MIKDNITPVLKNRFRKEVRKTMETGKERGFFICKDDKGKFVPSKKTCEGDVCEIQLKDPKGACPVKIQGDFHTHPYLATAKMKLKEEGKKIETDIILKDKVRKSLIESHAEYGIKELSAVTPSYTDALISVLVNCNSDIEGTVCVGSDLEDDRVECWTPKEIKFADCVKVEKEYPLAKKMHLSPRKWIADLFEKETIYLNSKSVNQVITVKNLNQLIK